MDSSAQSDQPILNNPVPQVQPANNAVSVIASQIQQLQKQEDEKKKQQMASVTLSNQPSSLPNQDEDIDDDLGFASDLVSIPVVPSDTITAGSKGKERETLEDADLDENPITDPETVKYQEISKDFARELEEDTELAKMVREIPDPQTVSLPKPVTDDYNRILVEAATLPKPKIVLPLTAEEMHAGAKFSLKNAFRWFVETFFRVVRMNPGRVFYSAKDNLEKQ